MGRQEAAAMELTAMGDFALGRNHQRVVLEGGVLWLVIGLVVLSVGLPWAYLAWLSGQPSAPIEEHSSTRPTGSRSQQTQAVGPWGKLSKSDIVIAAPLEFVYSVSDTRTPLVWRIRNTTSESFAEMLANLSLDDATRRELASMARPDPVNNGLVLSPHDDFVWGLKPETRAVLYHALALDTANEVQTQAFRFNGTLAEWFHGSGVSDETMQLVTRLAYPYKQSVFLADLHVLLPKLSKNEQTRVLKAVSGQRTLSLTVHVDPKDNIAELTEYWGRGSRAKDVRPLLESLAKVEGGGTIDVAHLLPAFARSRIYTYPTPSQSEGTRLQNCHWTAFNFFCQTPDDRFTNLEDALEELKKNYHPIYRNPVLGDLVVFSDAADPMFHVAVYIADDVVFTKNGTTFSLPWMYMRLDQMQEFYGRPLDVKVNYFRHKSL